ncbi:hypothetical protein OJF2_75260 [Aquisphaera giovannonii]|uniref:Limiting CO2-inducible protein B/C beta carbonyic anhydrase domain-containing protein n=2 Tax=Aquisphaera giovannonii TaxID=406548 RepID=A0A5B9WE47_9BACT|nr:hypothetical protein OJF2_75260 [Aquisphaera giovannonii]
MIGPFILGGLDGYPFVGKTGIGAFSHHVPEGGAALMFVGPHVGITDDGQVGKVVRPGQTRPSDCCGAASAALRKLEAGRITPKEPACYDPDDYQQEALEQLVLRHAGEILGPGKPDEARRFVRMTEVIYREAEAAFFRLLKTVDFEAPAFAFGGILINRDGDAGASIALHRAARVDNKQLVDMTAEFTEWSEAKFKEIEAGKADALR